MQDAVQDFDTLMTNIRYTLDRGTGRNLTAVISIYWQQWSNLIGRGRPFGTAEAAAALGVPRRSIHTAMYRIRQRSSHPLPTAHSEPNSRALSNVSEDTHTNGWIERSPHFQSGDRADYTQRKIVRSDHEFGEVRIDPETGNADYSI